MNRLLDGAMPGANLHRAHAVAPRKQLLASEGCNCPSVALDWNPAGRLLRAQRYAHDVLDDLNSWSVGWTDWNLLLDHEGGPNHLGNVCDAPLLANEDESDVIVQPYYYVLGHFSKVGEFRALSRAPSRAQGFARPLASLWHSCATTSALAAGPGSSRAQRVPRLVDSESSTRASTTAPGGQGG